MHIIYGKVVKHRADSFVDAGQSIWNGRYCATVCLIFKVCVISYTLLIVLHLLLLLPLLLLLLLFWFCATRELDARVLELVVFSLDIRQIVITVALRFRELGVLCRGQTRNLADGLHFTPFSSAVTLANISIDFCAHLLQLVLKFVPKY